MWIKALFKEKDLSNELDGPVYSDSILSAPVLQAWPTRGQTLVQKQSSCTIAPCSINQCTASTLHLFMHDAAV